MKEREIVKYLADFLNDEDELYEVVIPINNEEVRTENVVSIVLDSVVRDPTSNPHYPDYDYAISLYISTHIDEDEDGAVFEETSEKVESRMEQLTLKELPFREVFMEIPIVGIFFEGADRSIVDDASGKCNLERLQYKLVGSF